MQPSMALFYKYKSFCSILSPSLIKQSTEQSLCACTVNTFIYLMFYLLGTDTLNLDETEIAKANSQHLSLGGLL